MSPAGAIGSKQRDFYPPPPLLPFKIQKNGEARLHRFLYLAAGSSSVWPLRVAAAAPADSFACLMQSGRPMAS